jgi:GDSL-like Lipase/Acylhydrolase family
MGDSYAAGTAAGNYYHEACYRSPNNYAHGVSAPGPLGLAMDVTVVACHGAEIPHITGTYQGESPQIDSVNKDLDLVTISIGGNDLGFGPKLRVCATGDCTGDGPLVTRAQLDSVKANLVTVYRKIRENMRGDARLVVLTYPRMLPKLTDERPVCPTINNFLEWDEVVLIEEGWTDANFMLKSAVATARSQGIKVEILDVLNAFDQKDICSDDPYGAGFAVPDLMESFHPNAKGHAKEASMLRDHLRGGRVGSLIGSINPGSDWSQWDPLSGTVVGEVSTAALNANRTMAFARGTDNVPYVNYLDGWSSWHPLGGSITSSITATVREGNVYIAALHGTTPYVNRFNGTTWTGWQSLGGALQGPPTLVSPGPGTVMVIGRGIDNAAHVNTTIWDTGWKGWQSMGGAITTDPVAAKNRFGGVDVIATTNGAPYFNQLLHVLGTWSGWQSLGGHIQGRPAVLSPYDIYVVGRDASNAAVVNRFSYGWPGGWSGWQSLSGGIIAADPVITGAGDKVFVAAPGMDNRLYLNRLTTQWQGWSQVGSSGVTQRSGITSGASSFAEVVSIDSADRAPYHLTVW